MIFADDVSIRITILILGLCGFLVARHVYKHKNNNKNPLVCPIRFDCNTVVHSDYSRLFGIPVEILGMLYYALVGISYFFFALMPAVMPTALVNSLIVISSVAFLFSLYLIAVQIFILRKGCSWCIVSAIISALIFILTALPSYLNYLAKVIV